MDQPAVLPSQFNCTTSLPAAAASYQRRYAMAANNSRTYAPGDVIQFTVPTGQPGSFLSVQESALSFQITLPASAAAIPAGRRVAFSGIAGASSIISAIRVYCAGALITELTNARLAYEMVHDLTCGTRQNVLDTLSGAPNVAVYSDADGDITLAPAYLNLVTSSTPSVLNVATGAWTGTFVVPLLCGLCGITAQRACPTMLIAPGSLTIEITLAANGEAISCTDISGNAGTALVNNYSVSNAQLLGTQVFVDSSVADAILAASPSGVSLYANTVRNITASTTGTTTPIINVPQNYASVNHLAFTFHVAGDLANSAVASSRRVKPVTAANLNNPLISTLRIGSESIPASPVSSNAQTMMELLLANAGLWDRDFTPGAQMMAGSLAAAATFGFNGTATGRTTSFALFVPLDVYALASNQVRSGRNCVGQPVTLSLTGVDDTRVFTVQCWSFIDQRIVLRPGGSCASFI